MNYKFVRLIFLFPLVIFFFSGAVSAESLTSSIPNVQKLCGSAVVKKDAIRAELEKFKKNQPEEYGEWLAMISHSASVKEDEQAFWAYKFTSGLPVSQRFYQVIATLKRSSGNIRVWVENSSISNNYVNEPILDSLITALVQKTSSRSLFPNKGIFEIDTLLFGQPPNYDGDNILDFLVLDILDDFDSTAQSSFTAGYFTSFDQTNDPASNKRDIMYIDAYPGIYYRGNYSLNTVLSTTAHELQHLIHFNYDENEEDWLNEGLSELAGTYCGYGLDYPDLFLNNTNVNLAEWSGEVKDYARVNLWTLYCAEQLGLNFIKKITQLNGNGISSFNQAIEHPANIFEDFFRNWCIANTINDAAFQPEYGYLHPEARSLKAKPARLVSEFYGENRTIKGIIKQNAMEIHRLRGSDSLKINFISGMANVPWYLKRSGSQILDEFQGNSFSLPDFSLNDELYFVLPNTVGDKSYEYIADALYSVAASDLGFGGEQADINIQIDGIAANKVYLNGPNWTLEEISFWNSEENADVRLHFYEAGNGGPGAELISPIDLTVPQANRWVSAPVLQNHSALPGNAYVYLGVEMLNSGQAIGYNDTNQPGNSYLYRNGNWVALRDLTLTGGQKADGVWMIRGQFSKLILSDSLNAGETDDQFKIIASYPNPFQPKSGKIKIRFRIPEAGETTLRVFNNLGQKIAEQRETYTQGGPHKIDWLPINMHRVPVAAGFYYFQLIYNSPFSEKTLSTDFIKQVIVH